jgi:hypothetical protein
MPRTDRSSDTIDAWRNSRYATRKIVRHRSARSVTAEVIQHPRSKSINVPTIKPFQTAEDGDPYVFFLVEGMARMLFSILTSSIFAEFALNHLVTSSGNLVLFLFI